MGDRNNFGNFDFEKKIKITKIISISQILSTSEQGLGSG